MMMLMIMIVRKMKRRRGGGAISEKFNEIVFEHTEYGFCNLASFQFCVQSPP
jgi:hypothetical protein